MPQPSAPMTATMPTCALCGDLFAPIPNRREHCSASCKRNDEYRDPPQHAADLEALSVEFIAALLIDAGYTELMLSEASIFLARQGRLPERCAA